MAKDNAEYNELIEDLKREVHKPLYAFYGEERILLARALAALRRLIPEGTEEFNHRRLDGRTMDLSDLADALDQVPVFSDFVLVEISDFDFTKLTEETRPLLTALLADIPEYTCVVFICGEEFRLDGRLKVNKELKALFSAVEFNKQEGEKLRKWVRDRFAAWGKTISDVDIEYLTFITGGLMATLSGEVDKVAAYSRGSEITRSDIDAVVVPVLEAQVWELTDALLGGKTDVAAQKLGTLLALNEEPRMILGAVGKKLRQLMAAKALSEEGVRPAEMAKLLDVREYMATNLIRQSRKYTLEKTKLLSGLAAEAAWRLNSARGEPEKDILAELVVKLAVAV